MTRARQVRSGYTVYFVPGDIIALGGETCRVVLNRKLQVRPSMTRSIEKLPQQIEGGWEHRMCADAISVEGLSHIGSETSPFPLYLFHLYEIAIYVGNRPLSIIYIRTRL